MKRKDQILLARYRLGNECRAGEYWREERERRCMECEEEEETMEHIIAGCGNRDREEKEKNVGSIVREVLREDWSGLEELRRLEERREKKRRTLENGE